MRKTIHNSNLFVFVKTGLLIHQLFCNFSVSRRDGWHVWWHRTISCLTLLISRRRRGLAYFTLHTAKQEAASAENIVAVRSCQMLLLPEF